MFPGNIRCSAAFFSLAKWKKSKGLPALINLPPLPLSLSLSLSLSLLITLRRQCQGHEFCPHHYLLITVFVQARSVGGNRWCVCVTVCFHHQTRSALVRVDRVDMCPDHKAQTCIQVTNVCLTALRCPPQWAPETASWNLHRWVWGVLTWCATKRHFESRGFVWVLFLKRQATFCCKICRNSRKNDYMISIVLTL